MYRLHIYFLLFFFFKHPPPPERYTLSLHDALPICAKGGEENDIDVRCDRLRRAKDLDAGEARHLEVRHHEVDSTPLEPLERAAAIGGEDDPEPLAGQRALETLAEAGIVVGDQQRRGVRHGRPS